MKFRDYTKYEVFDDGRIYSYSRNKFLKPVTTKDGYQRVVLTDNECKAKLYYVHRVVWEAVTGKPIPENLECNHKNETKTDNRFCNLNLLTTKQNNNWGTRNKRLSKSNTNNKKISKAVGAFKDGKLVLSFPSIAEAQRKGFNQGAVSYCCRNCYLREGNNVFKGYEWRYI